MRAVRWSRRAERELEAYLDWYGAKDERLPAQLRREMETWAATLARRPTGNRHKWPGFLTALHDKRRKIIIYQVFDDHIEIAAFRDQRQDNSGLRLAPRPE